MVARTVTCQAGRGPEVSPGSSLLHLVHPNDLRRTFALTEGEVVLGRDPGSAGLVLEHATVSRRHAALAWDGRLRAHALRDLQSRNGAQVDGVRGSGQPQPLVSGSVVRLGDLLLVYEQGSAAGDLDGLVSREAIPGEGCLIRRLRAQIDRAAVDPAPALIIGETGAGKERVAGELHRLSGRPGPLVALNCAALSGQIVEAQLFGHLKGAFTGATAPHQGLFRAADGGTLFLDEIGELASESQPKLLRVLQEGELLPVGSSRSIRVDVRVVAATHRDLARAITTGDFRQDLYARLSRWELLVPPLRERRVDLFGWIERLHARWTAQRGAVAAPPRFDADAAEILLRFAWPLNLRGVERLVHELGARGDPRAVVVPAALPHWLGPAPEQPGQPASAPDRSPPPTREAFIQAFEELGGSVHGLARRFDRDRRQIYRWLESYGLSGRRGRAGD
jgi:transcriptional regulator with GAF, ATPase, and Fis domain